MRPAPTLTRAHACVYIPLLVACVPLLASCGNGGGINDIQVPTTASQEISIDVTAIDLDGDFLLNGSPFPASNYERGDVHLITPEGDAVLLGNTAVGSYGAPAIAGTYTSAYAYQDGGAVVPLNMHAPVDTGLVLAGDGTLDVDVTAVTVTGVFTLNGGAFPASNYENAEFLLVPAAGGAPISLGFSHLMNAPIQVIPGVYDVVYALREGGSTVPINQNAVLQTGVDIQTRTTLNIDVTAVTSRASFLLDGAPWPLSQYEHGRFLLRNPSTGDQCDLGESYQSGIIHLVIEGTYDVVYQHVHGAQVPANKDAVVQTAAVIDAGTPAVSVDVLTAEVAPDFTLNGGAFPVSQYDHGEILLKGATEGDLFLLGESYLLSPDPVLIVRGTYDVHFRHVQGDTVPRNAHAVVSTGHVINAPMALAIDVVTVDITPSFTLDGASFPGSVYEQADFHLQGALPNDRFLLGRSHLVPAPVRIVPGMYDVHYSHGSGAEVPLNGDWVLQTSVALNASQGLAVPVLSREVQGSYTLNGGAFPVSVYEHAAFVLRDPETDDEVLLGLSYDGESDPIRVIRGSYDIVYAFQDGGQVVPINEAAVVGSVQVTAP